MRMRLPFLPAGIAVAAALLAVLSAGCHSSHSSSNSSQVANTTGLKNGTAAPSTTTPGVEMTAPVKPAATPP